MLDALHKYMFHPFMEYYRNTPRTPLTGLENTPFPSTDDTAVARLILRCPEYAQTPLLALPALAAELEVAQIWVKDERTRMGLGSFKALGAAYVIAHDAQNGLAQGRTYVTSSAGNHGMSVAAGAAAFGASAVIYIAETVPEVFADRLRALGAEVVREGAIYEDSLTAAMKAAEENGWELLSDTSWPGYYERPHRLMEGYTMLMREVIAQIPNPPTHIMLQAGVGGLACSCAAMARKAWGETPEIVVIEPEAAPALMVSLRAGKFVSARGPVSNMGRLDCKEASYIALNGLARDADAFMTLSEEEGSAGAALAAAHGMASSESGAAGLAGLKAGKSHLKLDAGSRVLCILSEGPA